MRGWPSSISGPGLVLVGLVAVGQPDPSLRHQPALVVGDGDVPQLERPALAGRTGVDLQAPLFVRAEEIAEVVHADHVLAAVRTARNPPTLAAVSIAPVYSAPCTIPVGW